MAHILAGITEADLLACLPGTPSEIVERLRVRSTDPERFAWQNVNPNVVNTLLARTKRATFSVSEPIVNQRGRVIGRQITWRAK